MAIYCLTCKSPNIEELVLENRVYYNCQNCGQRSGRALIVNDKIRMIRTREGIKHFSVAAIIRNKNKILLVDRRTHPFGLELPVGHLEHNESLEEAIEREIYEELGIKAHGLTLIAQFEQPKSECRYGSDVEEWSVFSVEHTDSDAFPSISNNESESLAWYHVNRIPINRLTDQTAYALRALGIIKNEGGML